MPDEATRAKVDALLEAVRERPRHMPLAEIVALAAEPVDVVIDRSGDDSVVYVETRRGHKFEHLSVREREVAALVAAGFSNQQIGDTLFISLATVKDHVHSILRQTGCASRTAVAASWYS